MEDRELEEILLREARSRVEGMRRVLDRGLDAWDLFSHAHSLTGIAGTLGEEEIEALARDIASRVHDLTGRTLPLTEDSRDEVLAEVERIEELMRDLDRAPDRLMRT